MKKLYLEHNGVCYYGYDVYLDNDNNPNSNTIYFCRDSVKKLEDILANLKKNPTFTPAKGDEICVIPDCKYNLEDVRRNYRIKRGYDKGTCNVFSEEFLKKITFQCYYLIAIIPSKKAAVGKYYYNCSDADLLNYACTFFPDVQRKDIIIVKSGRGGWTEFANVNLNDAYFGLFNGTLKTPAVHIDNLDLNTGEELTVDALEIVHKLCIEQCNYASGSWDDKLKLQLAALNNLDWRKYPGTLNVLFNEFKYYGSVFGVMRGCSSKYPKNVKNFLKFKYNGFASKEDLNFACSFIRRILDLEGKEFSTIKEIIDMVNEKQLHMQTFFDLFDNMVRFRDKEWKDE